jgi:HK97 family phage portal protein
MSIFEKITKGTEQIKEQIEREDKAGGYGEAISNAVETFHGSTLTPKTKAKDYLRSAQGWVYGCVGVISDEIASINLRMMQFKNGEQTELDEHEALDVIYRANNSMSRFDLINLTFNYLELTGEAPWFISFKNGKPDSILLLRPDRLTVLPGKDGEMIGGYKYRIYKDSGVDEIKLEPYEVIPLKYTDPDQPLRGKGPLQAAAVTYDLDNYAEKWNSQFFRNSASPSAALQTDKVLAKDVRDRLTKKLSENYEGVDNAHKTMILENGLKWQSMSLTQKDMDFIEQQRFSRDKILAIFRVPRTALGITDDVNRANAEATDYVFAKRTIKPKMIRFVEQLNEFYLPLFGNKTQSLFFDFDDPVPENTELLIKKADAGVRNGYMTVNEAREMMKLDPIDGGDVLRDPSSFAPVVNPDNNKAMVSPKSKKHEATRYQKHMIGARTRRSNAAGKKKKIYEQVMEKTVVPIIFNYLKTKRDAKEGKKRLALAPVMAMHKGTDESKKEAKLAFQKKQLNIADKYEEKVIAKLNFVFDVQRGAIIRALESGDKMKLDAKVEANRYAEVLKGPMVKMMREQADLAFQILGVNHPFNDNPKALKKKPRTFLQSLTDYFEARTFRFATEVTRETNKKLQAAFKEGTAAGESIPQLASRVSTLFEEMAAYRSQRIARTETILASNFSTEAAYIDSGVVEGKEWLATMDERTDDECAGLDGKVVELGGEFFQNDYFDGQYPPIHVNCRCTLIPIVKA